MHQLDKLKPQKNPKRRRKNQSQSQLHISRKLLTIELLLKRTKLKKPLMSKSMMTLLEVLVPLTVTMVKPNQQLKRKPRKKINQLKLQPPPRMEKQQLQEILKIKAKRNGKTMETVTIEVREEVEETVETVETVEEVEVVEAEEETQMLTKKASRRSLTNHREAEEEEVEVTEEEVEVTEVTEAIEVEGIEVEDLRLPQAKSKQVEKKLAQEEEDHRAQESLLTKMHQLKDNELSKRLNDYKSISYELLKRSISGRS